MKFKIDCANFFKTLTHLQGIVDKKNSLQILSNILIEASGNELTLSSTDMDISIIEKIDCNVLEDGSTTINSQILYDIVRKIDDNINSLPLASIKIFDNIGKLFFLSTIPWRWDKVLEKFERTILNFIAKHMIKIIKNL